MSKRLIASLAFIASVFQPANAAETMKTTDDERTVLSSSKPPARIFARRPAVQAREHPWRDARPITSVEENTGLPALQKLSLGLSEHDDYLSNDWYQIEIMGHGNAYVSSRDVVSEEIYHEIREGIVFSEQAREIWASARSRNNGPLSRYAGIYAIKKKCPPWIARKESAVFGIDLNIQGKGVWMIWFEGDVYHFLPMASPLNVSTTKLVRSREIKGKLEDWQWYKVTNDEIAFTDNRYAYNPNFKNSGVTYQWAKRCHDESAIFDDLIKSYKMELEEGPPE